MYYSERVKTHDDGDDDGDAAAAASTTSSPELCWFTATHTHTDARTQPYASDYN